METEVNTDADDLSMQQFIKNGYQIVKVIPTTVVNVTHVMEELMLKAIVNIDKEKLIAENVNISVETDLKHLGNMKGLWHNITLPFRGTKDENFHVYGEVLVMVEEGKFDFIWHSKLSCEKKGIYYPSPANFYSVTVNPPQNLVLYAQLLRVPYMSHMIGPIWIGNEWAAIQAKNNNFTHMMCLAAELDQPFEDLEGRCFCKIPMLQGVKNAIDIEMLKTAVIWLKRAVRDGYKILLYSKHGFGRPGSVMVGFVMYENPLVFYRDALARTSARRTVLPHKGLKKSCITLFRVYRMSKTSKLSKLAKERSNITNKSLAPSGISSLTIEEDVGLEGKTNEGAIKGNSQVPELSTAGSINF